MAKSRVLCGTGLFTSISYFTYIRYDHVLCQCNVVNETESLRVISSRKLYGWLFIMWILENVTLASQATGNIANVNSACRNVYTYSQWKKLLVNTNFRVGNTRRHRARAHLPQATSKITANCFMEEISCLVLGSSSTIHFIISYNYFILESTSKVGLQNAYLSPPWITRLSTLMSAKDWWYN